MLYTIPDYYRQFQCTADKCEDTCCAGWQIVVDEKSLNKYKKVKGDFRKRLRKSVDWKEGTFKQCDNKRCAFLNEENLCDMYTALGEKSLCKTCKLYPRHIEEFENVREITLSMSCPEAAKILLSKNEPVKFLSYEKEGEEEYDDFDFFLYSKLVDGREVMIDILQDREKSLEVRCGLVLGIAHDMQVRIKKGEIFSCDEVFDKYQTSKAERFIEKKLQEIAENPGKDFQFAKEMFCNLYELEQLRDDWEPYLWEVEDILYQRGAKNYHAMKAEFRQWMDCQMPEWKIQCEQLLVYFISTYFCGAVYDDRAYAKTQMSVISVFLIYELLLAQWYKNEKMLDMEDVVNTVYRYSRELEHSDLNLEKMEKMLKHPLAFM